MALDRALKEEALIQRIRIQVQELTTTRKLLERTLNLFRSAIDQKQLRKTEMMIHHITTNFQRQELSLVCQIKEEVVCFLLPTQSQNQATQDRSLARLLDFRIKA